jgi:pseudouridine synthase
MGKVKSDERHLRPQRLNKILSLSGITSRRKADELIISGRVTVNDHTVRELGVRANLDQDRIKVDGKEIPRLSERLYILLNKPFGYVCTLSDPEGRPLVTELLKGIKQRVYPVGRLDFDSMGLLLFTNDGEWAYRLTHPSYQVQRTYKADIEGRVTDAALNSLKKGVQLEDGSSGSSEIELIKRNDRRSTVRIVITQGRNRQVRRMFEAVGFRVVHLIRTGIGGIEIGDLKVGEFRHLSTGEVRELKKIVGLA